MYIYVCGRGSVTFLSTRLISEVSHINKCKIYQFDDLLSILELKEIMQENPSLYQGPLIKEKLNDKQIVRETQRIN
jgi:hypothetical protein